MSNTIEIISKHLNNAVTELVNEQVEQLRLEKESLIKTLSEAAEYIEELQGNLAEATNELERQPDIEHLMSEISDVFESLRRCQNDAECIELEDDNFVPNAIDELNEASDHSDSALHNINMVLDSFKTPTEETKDDLEQFPDRSIEQADDNVDHSMES